MRTIAALGCMGLATLGCTTETLDPIARFDLPESDLAPVALPARIGFGSCSDPTYPMPALDVATELAPELYVWLGDNIYADTTDPAVMRAKYAALASSPEMQRLRDRAHLLATWDDHDYGQNDAGRDYPMKAASKDIFLEFWLEPPTSERWDRDGIYTAYTFEDAGHRLQIVLLDTRYNRDPLIPNDGTGDNDYLPHAPGPTLLGDVQWAWLEEKLREPADLRLIVSSIQFANAYNGYESWSLFPAERQRFVDLIVATRAEGVLFVSGDVHWSEISRLSVDDGYDLYDVTSSGINEDWPFVTPNLHRVDGPVAEHNVGMLDIDWDERHVTASIYDFRGAIRTELSLAFDELSF